MKDQFGNEVSVEHARALQRLANPPKGQAGKGAAPNGYASLPGSGPEGQACRTCQYAARIVMSKTIYKCRLMQSAWTNTRRTDILARSPACLCWAAEKVDP